MLLLGKMDARRLKEKLENENYCHAHECEHCVMLMKFQWKVKVTLNLNLEEVEAIMRHVQLDIYKSIVMKQVVFQCNNA